MSKKQKNYNPWNFIFVLAIHLSGSIALITANFLSVDTANESGLQAPEIITSVVD